MNINENRNIVTSTSLIFFKKEKPNLITQKVEKNQQESAYQFNNSYHTPPYSQSIATTIRNTEFSLCVVAVLDFLSDQIDQRFGTRGVKLVFVYRLKTRKKFLITLFKFFRVF